MTLSEIDKLIADYKIKVERKIFCVMRGKRRLVGIPRHLKKYYYDEIDKLEKQKLTLANLKEYQTQISWNKVKFEDHQIRIEIDKHLSDPFPVSDSRSSYQYLKSYIVNSHIKQLSITILRNKITSVKNLNELNLIIQILSIQNEINNYFENFESANIAKILSKLNKIPNQQLFDFFKLKQRSLFLQFLCEIQSNEHRIIPTTEILLNNDKIVCEDHTFLFTIKSSNCNYIIWESTAINKATYIFKSSDTSYTQDVQMLFDFIASNQNYKRKKLRFSIKAEENPFKVLEL